MKPSSAPPADPSRVEAHPSACSVVVLLPVYNGARYLRPQIESILQQSHAPVFILCRDDGSTDASLGILQALQQQWPSHMRVVDDGAGNLGPSGNFSHLMQLAQTFTPPGHMTSETRYVALSDQDDLWHPDKLERCLREMQRLEHEHPGLPALVHSDLRVIAEDGEEIAPSMARYQGLQTQHAGFAAQLLSSTLTGCTCLMNQAMLTQALPIPPQAIMHDWWLSLVASAIGSRHYIDEALIDYRQHAANAIGAKAQAKPAKLQGLLWRLFDQRHREIFQLNARQAKAFLQRYSPKLSGRQRLVLRLASLLTLPFPPIQRVVYRTLRRL